jgi:hypothetical protein
MNSRPTTIERAYQLAKSGDCASVTEIKAKLRSEGYTDAPGQLYGPTIQRSLRQLCAEAKAAAQSG